MRRNKIETVLHVCSKSVSLCDATIALVGTFLAIFLLTFTLLYFTFKMGWFDISFIFIFIFLAYIISTHGQSKRTRSQRLTLTTRDGSQTSHCNVKDLSVRQVMRIENVITQVKFY